MTPDDATELAVWLHEERVGRIRRSGHQDYVVFTFESGYVDSVNRPVLGQWFLDHLSEPVRTRLSLPPFFSNLLPEGPLRELAARRAGVPAERETFLLSALGEDLPGAVRVTPVSLTDAPEHDRRDETVDLPLKFSLAGLQLKFSVLQKDDGLSFPASGLGGDWLVKLPAPRFDGLPEHEWAMLQWAAAAGIEVPESRVVEIGTIGGLPPEARSSADTALAVRRFDRQPGGVRVHIEDFAQVLNLPPTDDGKYRSANYETLGRIISEIAPDSAFEEYVRRLVFMLAIGNGDAHVKNWSLIYRDRVSAELAPAYDLVSTIHYLPEDKLALNLGGSKDWDSQGLDGLLRLAAKAQASEADVRDTVRESVQRVRAAWDELRQDLPLPDSFADRLREHWRRLPLMSLQ